MTLHRKNPKRDKVEPAIVEALEKSGWSVLKISAPNAPDLLIYRSGAHRLVEVKTGNRKLRPGQSKWIEAWPGPIVVLRSVEQALALSNRECS